MNFNSPILVHHSSMRDIQEKKMKYHLDLKFLPRFASFLLKENLHAFAREQLRLSRELKLPLLKYLEAFSEAQILQLSIDQSALLLTSLSENNVGEFIEQSLKRWLDDQLPMMLSRDQIALEDIGLLNYIRRKALRSQLKHYTQDVEEMLCLADEIDEFTAAQDLISYRNLLSLQQDLYKEAQSLSNVGNWVWDLKSNVLTWSEELYRIYGLEPESEIAYHNIYTFNHPDDAELVKKEISKSIETGRPHNFYYRIILKNGQEKIVHALGRVKHNSQGKVYRLFGTLQDVTAQKLNEQELQAKTNALQELNISFDHAEEIARMSHWQWNVTTQKITFSDNLYRLLGCEPQSFEPSFEQYLRFLHPDDRKLVMDGNDMQTNQVEFQSALIRIVRNDGTLRYFQTIMRMIVNQFGEKVIIGINRDVTEEHLLNLKLKEANAQIKQRDERYQRMIEEIEDYAILLLDVEGNILNWNKGAQKIKGYTAEEIIGKNFSIFYTEEDLRTNRPQILLTQARERGRASDEGLRIRKDGSKFWCSIQITVLHDEQNNVIGFSKITRDLTERKKAEDKLLQYANSIQQKNEQLELSNAEMASFTYIASHDLREPLRKIKIFTNRIIEKETLSDSGKDYFRRIVVASDRMQNLIDALLSYSRVTTAEVTREETDLNLVLREVIENLAEEMAEKNALVECDKLPTLNVVSLQFHQLFINLIGNALKYSRPGVAPHIRIACEALSGKNAPVISPSGICYKISITDNGIGFEQKYADKIFELFQRLHGRTEYEGTGIGLAICKRIVQSHNGVINATSLQGNGSVFNLFLPA